MNYKIGVDIGTTSIKVILYDESYQIKAFSNVGYKTYHDQVDYAEQDPDEILMAFKKALREVILQADPGKIRLLAFSSAMHSLILMDKDGRPLTRSIIWSDNRSFEEVENFKDNEDWLDLYKRTGTPVHSMSPFFKLLWFKKNTELLEKTDKIIGIKEYILHELTGEYVLDYSVASATGIFNIHEMEWDVKALDYLNETVDKFSKLVDVTTKLNIRNRLFLKEMNLSEETKILVGASDGCLANLGSSAVRQGETTITIGTSGAVRMTVEKPLLDSKGRTFCYYLSSGRWVIGGAVNNGGNILHWLEKILCCKEGEIYKSLSESIREIPIGSDGLIFLPSLHGERAPFWDGSLRASFLEITAYHGKQHFIRAVLEGMLFNLKEVWEILENLAGKTTKMMASGGFLKNQDWAKMLADIFGMDYMVSETMESSSLGAVLLDEENRNLGLTNPRTISYQKRNHEEYRRFYHRYSWYNQKLISLHEVAKELYP